MNPRSAYLEARVAAATPSQLVVLLYDRALQALDEGARETDGGSRVTAHAAVSHAQRIVIELLSALDPQAGEIAGNLRRLYEHVLALLADAIVQRRPERLRQARAILAELRKGWAAIADQDAHAAGTAAPLPGAPHPPPSPERSIAFLG
jgi:flagellar protein FliS